MPRWYESISVSFPAIARQDRRLNLLRSIVASSSAIKLGSVVTSSIAFASFQGSSPAEASSWGSASGSWSAIGDLMAAGSSWSCGCCGCGVVVSICGVAAETAVLFTVRDMERKWQDRKEKKTKNKNGGN